MSDADFSKLAEPVARHFWGDPTPGVSTKTQLRFGRQGSRSVDLAIGAWFDHEAGQGGNVIELVMREAGTDKSGAIFWLEEQGFIPAREPSSGRQVRQETQSHVAPPVAPPADTAQPEPKAERKMVEAYDYVDRDGERLYQVVRFQYALPDGTWQLGKSGNPKKDFAQRRRDEKGNVVWNLDGIGHTIYRHNLVEVAIAEGKTIFMPEGEKDVHTLEGWGLVATTNSGGAGNWKPHLAEYFRGADVVVLGDDDEPGHKRVEAVARSLRGIAKRIRVMLTWGGPKDVTDWRDAGGDAQQLGELVASLLDWRPAPPVSAMGAFGIHQLHDPSLRHDFLIDGFLDRQGVAMMPGSSGSGKTFLVLEMAMSIALGRNFWGMATKPGVVLYLALEGKQGVSKRLDGWMLDRGVAADAGIPFVMLTKRINLFVDDKDVDTIIAEGTAWAEFHDLPVRMVVVDTLNKAMTGANENAGQDMSRVLSRLERISTELDCAVLVPMHKSKQGEIRGHTSLTGDVSNVINVTELNIRDRNGRIIRTVTLDKNKDGEKGKPKRFVLRQVVIDPDGENGTAITTCVVDMPDGDEEEAARQGKLSLNQILVLKALRQATQDFGEDAPAGIRTSVRRVVKYSRWEEMLAKTWQFTSTEPEKRKQELTRVMSHAGKALLAGEYIGKDNDLGVVWLTGRDDRPKREPKPIPAPMSGVDPEVRKELAEMEVPF